MSKSTIFAKPASTRETNNKYLPKKLIKGGNPDIEKKNNY